MNPRLRFAAMVLLAGLSQSAPASPTSDEFKQCEDMREASLRYCMTTGATASPGLRPDEGACRTHAQEIKDACYRQVYDRYRKPSPAEQAERDKRERAMREAQRRAMEAATRSAK